jgi:putative transposase
MWPTTQRRISARLFEAHDKWQVGERRYLSEGSLTLRTAQVSTPKEEAAPALLTTWSALAR